MCKVSLAFRKRVKKLRTVKASWRILPMLVEASEGLYKSEHIRQCKTQGKDPEAHVVLPDVRRERQDGEEDEK